LKRRDDAALDLLGQIRIAKQRGCKWNPYGSGFSRGGPLAGEPREHKVESEEDVFTFVGLPYVQPWERK